MPWRDWQFWVATGVGLLAAVWLFRGAISRRVLGRKSHGKARVALTIQGERTQRRG